MQELIVIRHGESEANISHTFANRGDGPGLTSRGRKQAAVLAAGLTDRDIHEIHSSPLVRSTQTAAVVAAALGLRVHVNEDLREYDVGALEGQANPQAWRSYADMEHRWLDGNEPGSRHPGGESYEELVRRFVSFVTRTRETTCGRALVVTHGGIFRMALPALSNMTAAQALRIRIPNCGGFLLRSNRSIEPINWPKVGLSADGHGESNINESIELSD